MIYIRTNINQVVRDFANITSDLRKHNRTFFGSKKTEYLTTARQIVGVVVYDVYEPKVYKPTGDLLRSIKSTPKTSSLDIWQDYSMTQPGRFGFPGYAHAVMMGRWEYPPKDPRGRAPRNFLDRWYLRLGEAFPKEYTVQVIDRALNDFCRKK